MCQFDKLALRIWEHLLQHGERVHIPASGRVHDSLARLLAECRLEIFAVVLAEIVTRHRLTAILVDSLKDLVTGGVAQTGEQRNKLSPQRSASLVLEDDLVQLTRVANLLID